MRLAVGLHESWLDAKPKRISQLLGQSASGPDKKLFARRRRPRWVCLGDQVPA